MAPGRSGLEPGSRSQQSVLFAVGSASIGPAFSGDWNTATIPTYFLVIFRVFGPAVKNPWRFLMERLDIESILLEIHYFLCWFSGLELEHVLLPYNVINGEDRP